MDKLTELCKETILFKEEILKETLRLDSIMQACMIFGVDVEDKVKDMSHHRISEICKLGLKGFDIDSAIKYKEELNIERDLTIGQAIDMLMKDEDLEFYSDGFELYKHSVYGIVVLNIFSNELLSPLKVSLMNKTWTVIPQPINFMKASQSGNKIKVKHHLINTKLFSGYYSLRYLMEKLSDNHSTSQIREILQNGEFYIK